MINLFHLENYKINTSNFSHFLHDKVVEEFENNFCDYVGAKYACSMNSATNSIFLIFLNKDTQVEVPSIIPPVVCNALLTSGNKIKFTDNIKWVGDSYVLHDFGNYKVIDSAQKVRRNQFKLEANDNDLMFFSFYPTKPVGSCDGGIIVSNNKEKIQWFKEACLNGMSFAENNWDRKIKFPGYKMYMNSFQAYIANENLKKLDNKLEKIDNVREKYNKAFGINNTSDHLYRINVSNRDNFMKSMKESGIQTGIHYMALHKNAVYQKQEISLPFSDLEENITISIPLNEKMKLKEIKQVIEMVNKHANRC
jgi:dTDP-4-amino-4,6-dideoxygalactose transaminase